MTEEEGDIQSSAAHVAQSLLSEMGSVPSSSTSSSSSTTPQVPATSQQMEEMINLLRDISTKDASDATTATTGETPRMAAITSSSPSSSSNNINGTTTAATSSFVNPSVAYSSGEGILKKVKNIIQQRIPAFCHPVRKFMYTNKVSVVLFALLIITFTTLSSNPTSNGVDVVPSRTTSAKNGGVMSSFALGSSKDPTLYYNVIRGEEGKPQPLPTSLYPDGGSVICILASKNEKDVADLQVALQSLAFLRGDTDLLSPILIFNEGDLNDVQMEAIRTSTTRPIAFPVIDLTSFPPGFDPEAWGKQNHFDVKDRKPWGYYQMIRFFVTRIWEHPAIARYETIMRMDSDSCFKAPNAYLPHMMYDQIVYHSQYVGVEPEAGRPYIEGLFDFVVEYMDRVKKTPGNVMLWHFIETTWELGDTLPVFRTNLEISRKSHMLRDDVKRWHRTLTEEEPFGLLRFRWGDAIIRFLEAAVFGTDDTVLTIRQEGYFHKRDCSREEVEKSLKKHKIQY